MQRIDILLKYILWHEFSNDLNSQMNNNNNKQQQTTTNNNKQQQFK